MVLATGDRSNASPALHSWYSPGSAAPQQVGLARARDGRREQACRAGGGCELGVEAKAPAKSKIVIFVGFLKFLTI